MLHLHAHNGSCFGTLIISNNLPCTKHIVGLTENGKGILSMKIFSCFVRKIRKKLQNYLIFICCMTHLKFSLKKARKN